MHVSRPVDGSHMFILFMFKAELEQYAPFCCTGDLSDLTVGFFLALYTSLKDEEKISQS